MIPCLWVRRASGSANTSDPRFDDWPRASRAASWPFLKSCLVPEASVADALLALVTVGVFVLLVAALRGLERL
jgi:hypothetical protein